MGPLFYVTIGGETRTSQCRTNKVYVFCFGYRNSHQFSLRTEKIRASLLWYLLVCFAKCGPLTLLGQPQPHVSSYFHFTRNNWTKRENLSLKRSTQVSFYYQTLGPGALCSYWLALQDSFRTSLSIRSFSLSKIAANHFHFRRFVWLPSNLSIFG